MAAKMLTANVPLNPIFIAPGRHRIAQMNRYAYQMITMGREVRDQHLWDYPILPGAINVFQQMIASREWKISGKDTAVSRAVDLINSSVTRKYDGTSEYGFEQLLLRQSLDWACLGRTAFQWEGSTLQYLDPAYLYPEYDEQLNKTMWRYSIFDETYDPNQLVLNHPKPIGAYGHFMAPLFPVYPTAMMSWLVREHDMASADGRKIRDIFIVYSEDLADQMKEAVESAAAVWSGANPADNGVSIVFVENPGEGMAANDYVARIGIANIPEKFDGREFNFLYANEIGNNLGMTLRQFWNIETGTNRALEDVQEARQVSKGPAFYVRSLQRAINACGVLAQINKRTRMGFIEEIDSASREINAKVLKAYSDALKSFAEVFGGTVNGDAFLAWLQSEGILPPDIDLITDIGQMQVQDQQITPQADDEVIKESDPEPSAALNDAATKIKALSAAVKEKIDEDKAIEGSLLDYDEISVDLNVRVIERRKRIFSLQKAVHMDLEKTGYFDRKLASASIPTFDDAMNKVRKSNIEKLKALKNLEEDDEKLRERILSDDMVDYRQIKRMIDKYGKVGRIQEADAISNGVRYESN